MNLIDFFDILTLDYAGLEEVQFFSGLNKENAKYLLQHLKELTKYKGLKIKDNKIPMTILVEYLNIDLNRVKKYHNEVMNFYNMEVSNAKEN